jgi:hypothetical protein
MTVYQLIALLQTYPPEARLLSTWEGQVFDMDVDGFRLMLARGAVRRPAAYKLASEDCVVVYRDG